jgi:hypothetical protein
MKFVVCSNETAAGMQWTYCLRILPYLVPGQTPGRSIGSNIFYAGLHCIMKGVPSKPNESNIPIEQISRHAQNTHTHTHTQRERERERENSCARHQTHHHNIHAHLH